MKDKQKSKKWHMAVFAAVSLLLIICDQAAKRAAQLHLQGKEDIVLCKGVFELHYLENRGSAFGMLQGQRTFFILMAVFVLLAIPYLYSRIPVDRNFFYMRIAALLFFAGAAGNAIDRVLYGYVIDFLYFSLINFPVFNVADIYVSVGTFLFVLLICFYYKEEDLKQLHLFG